MSSAAADIDHIFSVRTVRDVSAHEAALRTAAAERTVKLHQYLSKHYNELLESAAAIVDLKNTSDEFVDRIDKVGSCLVNLY